MPLKADGQAVLHDLAAMVPAGFCGKIAVAVSGGGDSMALLHAACHLSAWQAWEVVAVSVHHGLRAEADDELAMVARFCAGHQIDHHVLHWPGGQAQGNVMNAARLARYGLIGAWAQRQGIEHVFLGHTADDQAESFVMNLSRRAGLDGLSSMRPVWQAQGVMWHRPLLNRRRAALRDYLTVHHVPWADDPTNENDRYKRVQVRQILQHLAPLGIDGGDLAAISGYLYESRAALMQVLVQAVDEMVIEQAGMLTIRRSGFDRLPADLQRRLVICAVLWLSTAPYPPRGPAMKRFLAAICAGCKATLGGCVSWGNADHIHICREYQAVAGHCAMVGEIWDGRWQVTGPVQAGLMVRALGEEGLHQCANRHECSFLRQSLIVSPAIWQKNTLISAPLMEKNTLWTAKMGISFRMFVLAH